MQRWTQVRGWLQKAQVDPPDRCPDQGFIGQRKGYTSSVGVWLMPDCASDGGKLEHFLATLIPDGGSLWPYAQSSTDEAKRGNGAAFRDVDHIKACVHCWLAWQSDPGKPFGTAINAKFFRENSPQALEFLRWLKKLYALTQLRIV